MLAGQTILGLWFWWQVRWWPMFQHEPHILLVYGQISPLTNFSFLFLVLYLSDTVEKNSIFVLLMNELCLIQHPIYIIQTPSTLWTIFFFFFFWDFISEKGKITMDKNCKCWTAGMENGYSPLWSNKLPWWAFHQLP